ncbi:MAG: type II secretion system protein [bacterium]|nr:type II secretion system protein [bacterium]
METARTRGFTLIELLTVIAIISILAGFVVVGLPKILENAKISTTRTDFGSIQKALTTYAADNGTYPPAYGYRTWEKRKASGFVPENKLYWLKSYVDFIDIRGTFDVYDGWSETFDANRNGGIDYLEFVTLPLTGMGESARYDGSQTKDQYDNTVGAGQREASRPYIYVPVNLSQFKRVKKYYESRSDWHAETWTPSDANLGRLSFPPAKYDAYVLISVGPQMNSCGIVTPPADVLATLETTVPPENLYHVLGLRAYYLATRDANGNGKLDYDYESRVKGGDGKTDAFPDGSMAVTPDYKSDSSLGNLAGPLIFKQQG